MSGFERIVHPEVFDVRFKGVCFGFDSTAQLFDRVDFLFPSAGVVRISAPEGRGASSLLRILAGLRAPTRGTYLVNEKSVFDMPAQERERWQLGVGFGFDQGGLLSNYSLLDNLLLPLNYHQLGPKAQRHERARWYLEHFGIGPQALRLPALVSSGVRKACALARAFLLDPRRVFLDEPTQALDAERGERLAALIDLHRRERGLQQVMMTTEDAAFSKILHPETIRIVDRNLVQRG